MQLNPKVWLFLAIGAEVFATGFLKKSNGFTVISWTIFCLVLYVICHYSFSRVLEDMNLSVAYALWCGICIIASTVFSVFVYHQKISTMQLLFIVIIGVSCVLLNLQG